jgi:radical SAM superfamily enzyme YgiQ (UPF0313 family)
MAGITLATINAKWIHPSLALRLLKANLGPLEDSCEIAEFALRQRPEEKRSAILAAGPRILGLSVSIWNHKQTLDLLKELDKAWKEPGVPAKPVIVLGGPEVSFLPGSAEIFTYADFVIRGEGEKAFAELCASLLDTAERAGLAAFSGKFIETEAADLSRIDPGYRLYTAEDLDRKLIYVEASRGCPFGCEFCLSSVETGVREYPLEEFLNNLDLLFKRCIPETSGEAPRRTGPLRTFKFLDRSFNVNIPRAIRIMEFFLSRLNAETTAETAAPFQVHFEMVPGLFPEELKKVIARFPPGTLRLEIGLQTLNPETAALIKRPGHGRASPVEQELETLRFLRSRTRAIVHADLIAGLPGEDLASFASGFDRLWAALTAEPGGDMPGGPAAFEIQLGILKRLPGTPLVRRGGSYGMVYAPEPPYEVIQTAALSRSELDRIKNFARFWELVVNRGAFADLLPQLLPPGRNVFDRFIELTDGLYRRFGRNWGIDRNELRTELEACFKGTILSAME